MQQARNFHTLWNWTERMNEAPIVAAPAHFSVIPLASAVAGLSDKFIGCNVEDGRWIEERGVVRSSAGRVYIRNRSEQ